MKAEMPTGTQMPSEEESSRSTENAPAAKETVRDTAKEQDTAKTESVNETKIASKVELPDDDEGLRKFWIENLQQHQKMTYDEWLPEFSLERRRVWMKHLHVVCNSPRNHGPRKSNFSHPSSKLSLINTGDEDYVGMLPEEVTDFLDFC
jgi:hypothetical protein